MWSVCNIYHYTGVTILITSNRANGGSFLSSTWAINKKQENIIQPVMNPWEPMFILMVIVMAGDWVKRPPSLRRGWDPGWLHLPIRPLREKKTEVTCYSQQHCVAGIQRDFITYSDQILGTTDLINILCWVSDTARLFLPGLDGLVAPPVQEPDPVPDDPEFTGNPDSQEPQAASAPLASFHLGWKGYWSGAMRNQFSSHNFQSHADSPADVGASSVITINGISNRCCFQVACNVEL